MAIFSRQRQEIVVSAAKTQAVTLGASLAMFWGASLTNLALGGAFHQFGIIPRNITGLRGILLAPFLHGNLSHLFANSVPFLVLGWLILVRNRKHFIPVTILATLGAGSLAWLFGAAGSVHIGLSGVIFGYLGFLMLSGFYSRRLGSIALSVLVTGLWGSAVFGVLPGQPGVSWQSHLGGFVAGVWAAKLFRTR